MPALFRRKPAEPVATESDPEAATILEAATKSYTPPKARPTPKRSEAERRRRAGEPAPKNDKDAKARMRERRRAERAQAYDGMRRGDDKYLPARDKGPVRRLVRDLVDARRNVGTFFFFGAIVVVVGSMAIWPPIVRLGANLLWLGLIAAMLLDGFLIARLIRRTVRDRFPDAPDRMAGLYFYGIMRSVVFRRMRAPQPQVRVGDEV
ncbi:MAG TPA: DUF3043 domain-containing protein [Cryptosporangiaceae bacterium]|nr:DUF3043 domain-containing protein [Cryptosporangiaceae bacterium]